MFSRIVSSQNNAAAGTVLSNLPHTAVNATVPPPAQATVATTSHCPTNPASSTIKSVARSYASVLAPTNKPFSSVTHRNGSIVTIKLDEVMYQKALSKGKNNLLGRLIFHRGAPPIKSIDLQATLTNTWKISKQWTFTPIDRSFYVLQFEDEADMIKIHSYGQTKLKIGLIKISNWVPDFVPSKQKQTNAHVWARIHELHLEYFDEEMVLYLAGGIGTALQADPFTIKKTLGHFAKVLVDVDM